MTSDGLSKLFNTMNEKTDMTEEEAAYWDDYYTRNPPKTDPTRPGVFARRQNARMVKLNTFAADYLLTKSLETRQSPAALIDAMVRREMALS
jgi:hypothetical protein